MDLTREIEELERHLLTPATRASSKALDKRLTEDFIEIGASGRIYDKATILASLPEEAGDWTYHLTDFALRKISPDTVLATYRLVTYRNAAAERRTLRSSLWRQENGDWRMMFHQGTLIP